MSDTQTLIAPAVKVTGDPAYIGRNGKLMGQCPDTLQVIVEFPGFEGEDNHVNFHAEHVKLVTR